MYQRLPPDLLTAIGKFATCWAVIEQDVMLTASAIAAQDTGGEPLEHLRLDFKRLREKWFALARAKIGETKQLTQFNMELANASKARGYMLHGIWQEESTTQFRVYWFEQTKEAGLQHYEISLSLTEVWAIADRLEDLCRRFQLFVTGAEDGTGD